MKKNIVLLFSMLTIFAIFSCRNGKKMTQDATPSLSANNRLSAITFSSAVMGFKFSKDAKSYNVKLVNPYIEKIKIVAYKEDEKASIDILPKNEQDIAVGGSVQFTINCKAQNGDIRKTVVNISRPKVSVEDKSNNAFLKSVHFSLGSLLTEFNSKKLDGYTLLLESWQDSTRIFCIPEDDGATITYVNGPKIDVEEGDTVQCIVDVIASDGIAKKQYKFDIRRQIVKEEPALIDIIVGDANNTLSPRFAKDILNYTCNVANYVSKVKVKGIPLNKLAKVEVNPEGEVMLVENVAKTFTIKVSLPSKPQDIRTYSVVVTREKLKDLDATLKSLSLLGNDGHVFTLDPVFDKNTKNYTASVHKNFSGILELRGEPTSSLATVKYFIGSGGLGTSVGDELEMSCVVQAEAGNTETYKVKAIRVAEELLAKDANLLELKLKDDNGQPINISPEFDEDVLSYSVVVPFHFSGDIRATYKTKHKKAVATHTFTPEHLGAESEATQILTVHVVAEDVSVTKDYVVNIKRSKADDNADLRELHLKKDSSSDDVPIVPEFAPNVLNYTATVPASTRTLRLVWLRDSSTSTTIPEYPMPDTPYEPQGADNSMTLTLKVTAQSGVSKTYSIKVSSPAPNPELLKMVDVITTPTQVVGEGSEGVFVAGRTVTIAPYRMSETEVTYEAFDHVVQWGKKDGGFDFGEALSAVKKGSLNEDESHPACSVQWRLAVLWCNAYSKMKNKEPCYTKKDGSELKTLVDVDNNIEMDMNKNGYRLPTEVEWEAAARGGKPGSPEWQFKWAGVDVDDASTAQGKNKIGEFMWWFGNSVIDGNKQTHPPKGKKPTNSEHMDDDSYSKIYDLSGNVAEWVWDRKGAIKANTPITGNEGAGVSNNRVFRGWNCYNTFGATEPNELKYTQVRDRTHSKGISKKATEVGFRIVSKYE